MAGYWKFLRKQVVSRTVQVINGWTSTYCNVRLHTVLSRWSDIHTGLFRSLNNKLI